MSPPLATRRQNSPMQFGSEVDRRLTELLRLAPQLGEPGRKQRPWLEAGTPLVLATYQALLTDHLVAELGSVDRETIIHDAITPGLYVRIRPSGVRRFYVQTIGSSRKRSSKKLLGTTDDYTVDQARLAAITLLVRELTTPPPLPTHRLPKTITLNEAWTRYRTIKFSDVEGDRLGRLLAPVLTLHGSERIARLKRDRLLAVIERAAFADRNKAYELHKRLRALLSWCAVSGALDANPLANAQMPLRREGSRRRLRLSELGHIYAAASQLPPPWCDLVRFIMLTGIAVDRARRLQWAQLEQDNSAQRFGAEALGVVSTRPRDGSYVFRTDRGAPHDAPPFLRRDTLADLIRLSGVSGWSWRDLVSSVRVEMRSTSSSCGRAPTRFNRMEAWARALRAAALASQTSDGVVL